MFAWNISSPDLHSQFFLIISVSEKGHLFRAGFLDDLVKIAHPPVSHPNPCHLRSRPVSPGQPSEPTLGVALRVCGCHSLERKNYVSLSAHCRCPPIRGARGGFSVRICLNECVDAPLITGKRASSQTRGCEGHPMGEAGEAGPDPLSDYIISPACLRQDFV